MSPDEQLARHRHYSSKHSFTVVYIDGGRFALFVKGKGIATVKSGTMAEIADYMERACNPLSGLGI